MSILAGTYQYYYLTKMIVTDLEVSDLISCFLCLINFSQTIEHGEFVRVRTVHLNGKPRVLTLKQDLHYWPTWELRFDLETAMWRRKTIKALDSGVL